MAPLASIPSHLKNLFKYSDKLIAMRNAGTKKVVPKDDNSAEKPEESKINDVADEPIRFQDYPCETVNLDSLDSKFADNRGVVETSTRKITDYANNGAYKYAKARFD